MKVLIIVMYDSCYESSVTYLTENGIQDIEVREEWFDRNKCNIIPDQVREALKNEGLNTDIMLVFDNAELISFWNNGNS